MFFMFNELILQQEEHLSHLERIKQTLEDLRNDTRCETSYDDEEALSPLPKDDEAWWDWWF